MEAPDFLKDAIGNDPADLVTKLGLVFLILLATWLISRFIVARIIPRLLGIITKRTRTKLDDDLLAISQPPLRFLIATLGIWFALSLLDIPTRFMKIIDSLFASFVLLAIFWAIYRAIDVLVAAVQAVTRRTVRYRGETTLDEKVALAFKQLGKALVVILAFTTILQTWGYSIAGLMAGLGLGGLAVALAAQDALANLIGYFVILADEPFVIGEYIVVGDIAGTVENLGFRSTRIRVLDQSLVTVPNRTIVKSNVTNSSRLTKRRLIMPLQLPVTSTPRQVLAIVQAIREMLKAHQLVQQDSVIVQFTDLGKDTLGITLICFMKTPAWNDFQAARQDINLRIMQILARLQGEEMPSAAPAVIPQPRPEPRLSTATDSPVPDDAAN